MLKRLIRKLRFYPLTNLNPIIASGAPPVKPTFYPDGVCVLDNNGEYWLMKSGKRYKFASERCWQSWRLDPVHTTQWAIEHIEQAGILGFRDGTLLSSVADGKLWLVSGSKVRHVTTAQALEDLQLGTLPVIKASPEEIELHVEGEDI